MLGGPILASGVTNANFYAMIEIFLIFDQGYFLQRRHSTGNYYITKGRIFTYSTASAEFKQASSASTMSPGWFRTISVASVTWVAEFRDAVRQRDRRCGNWRGFEAAHIFPPEYIRLSLVEPNTRDQLILPRVAYCLIRLSMRFQSRRKHAVWTWSLLTHCP